MDSVKLLRSTSLLLEALVARYTLLLLLLERGFGGKFVEQVFVLCGWNIHLCVLSSALCCPMLCLMNSDGATVSLPLRPELSTSDLPGNVLSSSTMDAVKELRPVGTSF